MLYYFVNTNNSTDEQINVTRNTRVPILFNYINRCMQKT